MAATQKVTRKQLFDDLWEIGYDRSADKYGVSLYDLLQVYKKHDIPEPYETYFADRASGKSLHIPKLPGNGKKLVELHLVWKRRQKVDATLGSRANAICILQTLEDYSDANKSLSVSDIIRLMEENYRLRVDRRTIYTTIETLIDLGYDIAVDKNGSKNCYALLEKTLDPSDVKIIMDSLASNPLLPWKMADEINNKITKYLAKRMPLQKSWYWRNFDKTAANQDIAPLLYSYLDEIDLALVQGKKIEFDYLRYDTNGKKVPYRKEKFVVSPYQIKLENGMYYLCSSGDTDEEFVQTRLDLMTNVRMIDERANGKRIAGRGKPIGVTSTPEQLALFPAILKCDNDLIDKVTTDFHHDLSHIDITDNGDGKTFNFSLVANGEMITRWALSVPDKCEVLEPPELRDMVINKMKNNKYGI